MSAVFTCWIPRGLLALTAVGLGYALGARRPDDSGIAPNSLFIHPSATQPNALPPVSLENLAAAPVDAVLAWLTTFSGDAESAQKSLVALITDRPDLWMARALDPQAPQLLKNAADEFAKNNPRWTLEHLGDFDPATREPMIANILSSADNFFGSSLHPTLAGRNLTEWLEELTPEHRTSVIGGVAGMELMRDPDRALALAEEITDPKQRKVFYETVATFSAIEPRLLEKKLLQAKGTPEQIAQLRFAFAAGAQGTFSSPHDAMCRAASFEDPELRHSAIALTLIHQTDPAVRKLTFEWLEGMPPGTIDKQQLQSSLQQAQSHPEYWEKTGRNDLPAAEQFSAVQTLLEAAP